MKELLNWLEPGGGNLFQEIKAKAKRYRDDTGLDSVNLSIGQPTGPALLSAREAAAEAVMSDKESIHEYQDNGSPGVPDFARRFAGAHYNDAMTLSGLSGLSGPGIKSLLVNVLLACGHADGKKVLMASTTDPGYPGPSIWADYLGIENYSLPTTSENGFLFDIEDIKPGTNLLMINYPHNPSGKAAEIAWLRRLCVYCAENGIRIFNDAAYALLSFGGNIVTLAEAVKGLNVSWAEAYSASKVIANGTGWRVASIVGSEDYISDIACIKGNTDSGFAAFAAAGVIHAVENDMESIVRVRNTYKTRSKFLIDSLGTLGMKLAIQPGAGFFTLWEAPSSAFGKKVMDGEEFNDLVIAKTGIVGVPFGPYIRYAVVADVTESETAEKIYTAFSKAKISY